MFFGRQKELQQLQRLTKKSTASLVCLLGRRRIGKSALIEYFAKDFKGHFFEVQGLGPETSKNSKDELIHFTNSVARYFKKKPKSCNDWTEAFEFLANCIPNKGKFLILMDEISWMGRGDKLFASKLKEAWDINFKKKPGLILVACGSVSTWIEENILKNASFEGRISLEINLQELELKFINQFWKDQKYQMGSLEKMLILSVTGGVPKYLEEILKSEGAEQNLIDLCFTEGGFLFHEFEKIFTEIFGRKTKSLEKIVRILSEKKLSLSELGKKLGKTPNSELSEFVHILEMSGFVNRDYFFHPNGEMSKLSRLRLKDNYLRFYLKVIEPLKRKIQKGGVTVRSLKDLPNLESILGYQFENLILANRQLIYSHLGVIDSQIISAAPYFQKKTNVNKGACQIDLLIHTNLDVFFLCEFKCAKLITDQVIKEVQKKMTTITLPQRSAIKPILIYEGDIYPVHLTKIQNFFYRLIHFSKLLEDI